MSDVERGTEGSGEKLLVVDDDPFIARLLEIELAAAGYQVRVANDGQQAMDQVGQDAPDLVITDVMMPHVDGFELTRSLRQDPRTATISVIILTARGLSADKLEGFAIGADDYIVKPFDTPELLARVRGVLRRKREMKDESPLTGSARATTACRRRSRDALPRVMTSHFCSSTSIGSSPSTTITASRGATQVIQELAQMMQDVIAQTSGDDGFVGHLGGDDYVVVVGSSAAALVADTIVQRFDAAVPGYYDDEDLARGWIEVLNRRGEPQRYEPISLSIGVASTQRRTFAHFAEVMAIATEMKNFTKTTPGSSWAIDRRGP